MPSGTLPQHNCLLEKLHVIVTCRKSWLKHITHILTHKFLFFNNRQLVHTIPLYTFVIIITAFSSKLFIHRDFKLGGLSLTHNLQWHFVYGDMRGDFGSICKRHVSPVCTAQYCEYTLQLGSLIGECDSQKYALNTQSFLDDTTSLVMHVTRPGSVWGIDKRWNDCRNL